MDALSLSMDTSGPTAMLTTRSAIGTLRSTHGATQGNATAVENEEENGVRKTCLLVSKMEDHMSANFLGTKWVNLITWNHTIWQKLSTGHSFWADI